MQKMCIKCNETKDLSEFYLNTKRGRTEYHSYCKKCFLAYFKERDRTVDGLISKIYYTQKSSCKDRGHEMPLFSLDEFSVWIKQQSNFLTLYNNWVDSGFLKKIRPSVDRIDELKTYSFNNIRLVTWEDNFQYSIQMRRKGSANYNAVSVVKLDENRNFLQSYATIAEAAAMNDCCAGDISRVVAKKRNHRVAGFFWISAKEYESLISPK